MLTLFIISALALLAVAYWAFVTKPVKDEMSEEKRYQDSQAAARRAKAEAECSDWDNLFHERPINNN